VRLAEGLGPGGVDSTALRRLIDRHGEPDVVVTPQAASDRAAIDDPDGPPPDVDSTREVLDAPAAGRPGPPGAP
jgi:hypothetical protein